MMRPVLIKLILIHIHSFIVFLILILGIEVVLILVLKIILMKVHLVLVAVLYMILSSKMTSSPPWSFLTWSNAKSSECLRPFILWLLIVLLLYQSSTHLRNLIDDRSGEGVLVLLWGINKFIPVVKISYSDLIHVKKLIIIFQ